MYQNIITKVKEITGNSDYKNTVPFYVFIYHPNPEVNTVLLNGKPTYQGGNEWNAPEMPFNVNIWNPVAFNRIGLSEEVMSDPYRIYVGFVL